MKMQMMNWLEKRAALTPSRVAIQDEAGQLTFVQLQALAKSYAYKLAGLGVEEGQTIALLCENGRHTAALIHAFSYLKAILVPINNRLSPREIAYQLQDAECQLLIYDEQYSELIPDQHNLSSSLRYITTAALDKETAVECSLMTELNMDQMHAMMYTSGTTGAPKGVMLTYGNHFSSAVGSALNLGLRESDRWLLVVPMFHISGLSILMRSVIYGMTVVIHKKFDPLAVNQAIMEQEISIVSVVSNMLNRMIAALGDATYPAALRCMLLGGGPAPLPLLETCVAKHIPVFQTYGMTETASQIVTLQPEYMLSKLGSAGKPLFLAELRIMNEGKQAKPFESGEIVVSGPNITTGYWKQAEATASTFIDGWLYTGDIGYVDAEGFLYVQDRRKDMFVSGGENVYPAEIEAVISGMPNIAEVGVIGVPDDRWGATPAAFICLQPNAKYTAADIIQYCADKLAKYKQPTYVYFVDALPRNASNKLLRKDLAGLLPK